MSGLIRGAFQLAKQQLKDVPFGKLMEGTVRTMSTAPTGPVPQSGAFIKRGFKFGHQPFGYHYALPTGLPPVRIGADGLPSFVDWTVIPVAVWDPQDQSDTGLCYAFAALGAVSSLSFIRTRESFHLSAQQMIDCNTLTGDVDDGGFPSLALDYIKGGGILPSILYPFTGKQGVCQRIKGRGVTIDGWEYIKPNSEAALKYAVAHQPVVVSLCIGKRIFGEDGDLLILREYDGGILSGPSYSYTKLDHSVLLVGYGETELGELFWLLLNSWGCTWGEKGLFRLARSTGQRGGALGILREPLVPLKTSPSRMNRIVSSRCDSCVKCF